MNEENFITENEELDIETENEADVSDISGNVVVYLTQEQPKIDFSAIENQLNDIKINQTETVKSVGNLQDVTVTNTTIFGCTMIIVIFMFIFRGK